MGHRKLALLAGCAAIGLAGPALAQSSASSDVGEVVVTGSRVITNGNNSPTPVTVVSTDLLATVTPSNIPDALNRLPQFVGSSNQTTFGNGSSNAVGNYLNLRAVGPARTLILFDGHRFPPTTQDNLIDVNTIPQMLLERVDVVTGGASAVYGSDAITGVVNFVVDKNFNGLKLQAQTGISQLNDNASRRVGIAFGRDLFDGRGHFEASLEHYDSAGIDTKLTREYGRAFKTVQGQGTAANPYRVVSNSRLATYSANGLIKSGPFNDQVFNADGTLRPFVHGGASGTNGIEIGGDGIFYNSTLQAKLRSNQGFARFDYDVTENINFYVQGTATKSFNQYSKEENVLNNVTLSSQNAFLRPEYRAAMAAAGVNSFTFSREHTDVPRLRPTAWIENYYVIAGLDGSFGDNWTWDVAYSHSKARQKSATQYNTNLGRQAAALDAVGGPNGTVVCSVTITNPGLYPGCVPLNVFGPNTITAEAAAYVLQDTAFILHNTMDDLTAGIAGSPFSTWAGPVRMAVSGEFRRLTVDLKSDAQPSARTSCTGLRFNCNANTGLFSSNIVADAPGREQKISEAAIEADVPLLANVPLVRSLNVNAAARYTKYENEAPGIATSEFTAKTWKIGVDWHLTEDLSVRGTRSRDIRAPSLNDLFAPINLNPAGFTDLHTNSSGNVPIRSQGNPDLVPEVANTTTLGVVYRPAFIPGFSVAVDYFKIKIDNAIGVVQATNTSVQRECENSNGTSPLCALFVRPLPFANRTPANFPTLAITQGLNVATLVTEGVDGEVNYAMPLAGGSFSVRGLLSYQPKNETVNFPGSIPINQAGAAGAGPTTGQPKYRFTGFVHYDRGGVNIDVQQRWHSSTRMSGDPTLIYASRVAESYYTDLNIAYKFDLVQPNGDAELFLTIQNLFDKQPPFFLPTGARSAIPGFFVPTTNGDDPIGRYFTAGFRLQF
jgi:iron complex outermembrane receptor protein